MQIFVATIVDEPENAPTVLLAQSAEELVAKLRNCSDLNHLDNDDLLACKTADDIAELYRETHDDMYADIFIEEQML